MSVRWYEIPADTVALMAERHSNGDSFSKIGHDVGIDRRVVARAVREFETNQSAWTTIRSGALAEVFREHTNDMRDAANMLLEVTASLSFANTLSSGDTDIESEVINKLTKVFMPNTRLPNTGANEAARVAQQRLAEHRAKAALQGLQEHVPALQAKLEHWNERAHHHTTEETRHHLDAIYGVLVEMLGTPWLETALVTGRCRYCPVP